MAEGYALAEGCGSFAASTDCREVLERRLRCSNRQVGVTVHPDTSPRETQERDGPRPGTAGRAARLGRDCRQRANCPAPPENHAVGLSASDMHGEAMTDHQK
jgi:hypothetical protein